MTLRNGTVLSASNLDTVPRIGVLDLYEFKYLARPAQMAMAELKKLLMCWKSIRFCWTTRMTVMRE